MGAGQKPCSGLVRRAWLDEAELRPVGIVESSLVGIRGPTSLRAGV
jgi:hypothetical protein